MSLVVKQSITAVRLTESPPPFYELDACALSRAPSTKNCSILIDT